jgi:hypothetical protein
MKLSPTQQRTLAIIARKDCEAVHSPHYGGGPWAQGPDVPGKATPAWIEPLRRPTLHALKELGLLIAIPRDGGVSYAITSAGIDAARSLEAR